MGVFTQVASNIKGFARKFHACLRVLCEWGLRKECWCVGVQCMRTSQICLDCGERVCWGWCRIQICPLKYIFLSLCFRAVSSLASTDATTVFTTDSTTAGLFFFVLTFCWRHTLGKVSQSCIKARCSINDAHVSWLTSLVLHEVP